MNKSKTELIQVPFQQAFKLATCSHEFKCLDLPTAAMAGQLNSFVQKFYSLWKAGNDARPRMPGWKSTNSPAT
jgi:hypothetical protein